jgi:V-type H+-transporting ATPase subunit C
LGSNDGKFGKALQRSTVKGSPVVPGSLKKVHEEVDSVMFAVTVLRGHYQAGGYDEDVFTAGSFVAVMTFVRASISGGLSFCVVWGTGVFVEYLDLIKTAFRDKRYTVRELVYDSAKTGGVAGVIKAATEDLKQVKATVLRWCKAHFGEVFSGFVHMKVIQSFVESVLRYGLPVDFVATFIEIDSKFEKDIKAELTRSILNLRPELRPKKTLVEEEENPEDGESLPFVCLKFPVIGGSSHSTA